MPFELKLTRECVHHNINISTNSTSTTITAYAAITQQHPLFKYAYSCEFYGDGFSFEQALFQRTLHWMSTPAHVCVSVCVHSAHSCHTVTMNVFWLITQNCYAHYHLGAFLVAWFCMYTQNVCPRVKKMKREKNVWRTIHFRSHLNLYQRLALSLLLNNVPIDIIVVILKHILRWIFKIFSSIMSTWRDQRIFCLISISLDILISLSPWAKKLSLIERSTEFGSSE